MFELYFKIAKAVRAEMVELYGDNLAGKCIEASDRLVDRIFSVLRVKAVTVEGWCRYDDEYYGSDRPWDTHTWVEVPSINLYIDVTADQFNSGMFSENDFDAVIVRKGLPHGMRYDEPSWKEYDEPNFVEETVDTLLKDASERCFESEYNVTGKDVYIKE